MFKPSLNVSLFSLYSKWLHSDQEEIQVSVLQFLSHAPVYPEEAYALSHRREALPLWNLWQEVHPPWAHETAYTGVLRAVQCDRILSRGQHCQVHRFIHAKHLHLLRQHKHIFTQSDYKNKAGCYYTIQLLEELTVINVAQSCI